MIQDIPCLWQQLDGPQAQSLILAPCAKLKEDYDTTLNYFNNLILDNDSLTGEHVSTLGLLMGILYPIYYTAQVENGTFIFLYNSEQIAGRGFGDPNGGVLSEDASVHNYYKLSTDEFRELLQLIANSESQEGSLSLVDEICNYFFGVQYHITWGGYGQGQIAIKIPYDYTDIIDTVQSILDVYKPVCEVLLELSSNWEAD